jgi:hypothetical protein
MLCLLENWSMPTVVDIKVFLMFIIDTIEFICLFLEKTTIVSYQKYHSLESLYRFCSLAYSG